MGSENLLQHAIETFEQASGAQTYVRARNTARRACAAISGQTAWKELPFRRKLLLTLAGNQMPHQMMPSLEARARGGVRASRVLGSIVCQVPSFLYRHPASSQPPLRGCARMRAHLPAPAPPCRPGADGGAQCQTENGMCLASQVNGARRPGRATARARLTRRSSSPNTSAHARRMAHSRRLGATGCRAVRRARPTVATRQAGHSIARTA
jgi:hypothetical protein